MSGHSGPSGPTGFTSFRTGTGTIPASSDNSGGISVAGLGSSSSFSVVLMIEGTGSAFGGSCQTGLNGCFYLNVVKSTDSFFVQLRNPVNGDVIAAASAISFSWIAITNN